MNKPTRAKKRLEMCKRLYLDALKSYESEEEQRLAALYQPKVSLNNILHWSAYLQGARKAFLMMHETYKAKKGEDAIYTDAVFKLIISDLRYTGMFLTQSNPICYRNHKRDKKGKLISVEAYFAEPVTIYREV